MTALAQLRQQRGFTIVETLVAAAVLAVGLLGVVTLLDTANATNNTTKAREQGVALARELLEDARSIPYAQLTPSSIVPKVQAMPGMSNAGGAPGWTIKRRGVTYTVALGTCAVDDPADGYGVEDPNLFCASTTGQPTTPCSQLLALGIAGDANVLGQISGTLNGQLSIGLCGLDLNLTGRISDLTQADVALCVLGACQNQPSTGDPTPDDYRRIEATVTWPVGSGTRYALLATTVTNPGQGAGPQVTGLQTNFLPVPGPVSRTSLTTSPADVATLSVPFVATADSSATAVRWSLNGVPQGSATYLLGVGWTFSWTVGSGPFLLGTETLDGNYTIGATAFDQYGNAGAPKSMTFSLNRRVPYAPPNFAGGHDGSLVDLQWSPTKDGDVTGYQVYRVGTPDVVVCSTNNVHATSCQDTNPPTSLGAYPALIQYYVKALDPEGTGDASAVLSVTPTNKAPYAPSGQLLASTSNGNTVLAWTAPVAPNGAPPCALLQPPCPYDADGDSIDFYRIYRDGQAVANRYDTAPGNQTTYTDTSTGGVAHTYWVTAVDPQLAESPALGPVTR